MPQLDPTSFSSQLFWLTVSFVALYMLLARFLLPRVKSLLEMRAKTIESDIEQAERLKSEAERASEQYEKALGRRPREIAGDACGRAGGDCRARGQAPGGARWSSIEKKLTESDAAIKSAKKAVADKLYAGGRRAHFAHRRGAGASEAQFQGYWRGHQRTGKGAQRYE